jgi:hypothetical protein
MRAFVVVSLAAGIFGAACFSEPSSDGDRDEDAATSSPSTDTTVGTTGPTMSADVTSEATSDGDTTSEAQTDDGSSDSGTTAGPVECPRGGAVGCESSCYGERIDVLLASPGSQLELADTTGDGTLDAHVLRPQAGSIERHVGNGDGTFDESPDPIFANGADAFAIGLLDDDDLPDVVALLANGARLGQRRADGAGGFSAGTEHDLGVFGASDLLLGDVDGDGLGDAVVPYFDGIRVAHHDGDGFGPPSSIVYDEVMFGGATHGVLAELSPGRIDLAIAFVDTNNLAVFRDPGKGGIAPVGYPIGGGGGDVVLATGDFDSDADIDLLVSVTDDSAVFVLFNDGDGGFPSPLEALSIAAARLAVGDANGDCIDDFVHPSFEDGNFVLSVRMSQGEGSFVMPTELSLSSAPADIAMGDLNGDAIDDVVLLVQSQQGATLSSFVSMTP